MVLLVSPFEHCHTLWVSLSGRVELRKCGNYVQRAGGGGRCRVEVQWCTGAEMQR